MAEEKMKHHPIIIQWKVYTNESLHKGQVFQKKRKGQVLHAERTENIKCEKKRRAWEGWGSMGS
jgi:hypothetical protein